MSVCSWGKIIIFSAGKLLATARIIQAVWLEDSVVEKSWMELRVESHMVLMWCRHGVNNPSLFTCVRSTSEGCDFVQTLLNSHSQLSA